LLGHPVWGVLVAGIGGGLGFIATYGVFFFVPWALAGFKDWHAAYMKIPYEKQAYAKQEAYRYATVEHRKTIWGDT